MGFIDAKQDTATALAGAVALGLAGPAAATTQIYDFTAYQTGFIGSLGTVTVQDFGTNTLSFDVSLASNVFFQMQGNGTIKDALWFDLPWAAYASLLNLNLSAPNGGLDPTGGLFTGGNYSNNAYGQGFSQGYDYAVRVQDASAGGNLDYYGGHLTFTVTGSSPLSLASLGTGQAETLNGVHYNVPIGADLRQCLPGAACITGPIGAVATNVQAAIPEPATWLMMIMGFSRHRRLLRRRRTLAIA